VVADGRVVCKIAFCECAVHGSSESRALLRVLGATCG